MYQADLPVQLDLLHQATAAKDFPTIENLAHKMKGASANVCALQLNGTLRHLETAAKARDLAEVHRYLQLAGPLIEDLGKENFPDCQIVL